MATPDAIYLYIPADSAADVQALAQAIATRWQFTLCHTPPHGMGLTLVDDHLQLMDFADPKVSGVEVDFASGASLYRQQHGGGFKEPIAKAIGVKGNYAPRVIDATPGLGRDAFVLLSLGCEVHLIERSPVVAALLEDGIRRLLAQVPELAARLHLHYGNSIDVMQYWSGEPIDAIYLDPMFPHRKKSAAVKKEMRLFQQLLGADPDADGLLAPALALACQRVVVKRPNSAPVLADKKPSMAISSKKHRFDVYITRRET